MDIRESRSRPKEQERIAALLRLLPFSESHTVLDVGARDGYISSRLASLFQHVTALDLQKPEIAAEKITPVQGDVTKLEFPDNHFDAVVCAEVLEHIPPNQLSKACDEITRVARRHILIGVPYKQDTRVGRMHCRSCGKINPPWGHFNTFDEARLISLFPGLCMRNVSFIGRTKRRTNVVSAFLMDFAGNPYGTYDQDEPCVFCNANLERPPKGTKLQAVAAKLAVLIRGLQWPFVPSHASWIHMLFEKPCVDLHTAASNED